MATAGQQQFAVLLCLLVCLCFRSRFRLCSRFHSCYRFRCYMCLLISLSLLHMRSLSDAFAFAFTVTFASALLCARQREENFWPMHSRVSAKKNFKPYSRASARRKFFSHCCALDRADRGAEEQQQQQQQQPGTRRGGGVVGRATPKPPPPAHPLAPRARTHARTKRNDFPVGGTYVLTPPNLQPFFKVVFLFSKEALRLLHPA